MSSLHLSNRSAIDPFIVMDIMQAAAEREARGHHVLHLEVGQPCSQAPLAARKAAKAAIDDDLLGYTVALGLPALRARIAQHYREWYDYDLDPQQVAICAGASAAFFTACLAAFDTGARVAVPAPGYPCYRHTLKALGLEAVPLPLGPEVNYRPTPETLASLGSIDGLVMASPNNPTGTLLRRGELSMLADYCENARVQLISDEIYHGLTYDAVFERSSEETTALAFNPNAIVINSFSKYFSMTGWRVGWVVVPPPMVRRVELLSQNLLIATSTPAQHAAIAAFDCYPELNAHRQRYAENRQIALAALNQAGIAQRAPADGAFYIYADVGHLTTDSRALCARALAELNVAMTPGVDFDPIQGHRMLRISYARSTVEVQEAMNRLATWLPEQAGR